MGAGIKCVDAWKQGAARFAGAKTLRPLKPQPTGGTRDGPESQHQGEHQDSLQREPTMAVGPCCSVVSRCAGQIPGPKDMGTWPLSALADGSLGNRGNGLEVALSCS